MTTPPAVAQMNFTDLSLETFLPSSCLVPPDNLNSLVVGFVLLSISIFSVTCQSGILLRLALAPVAISHFWSYGYSVHKVPDVGVDVVGLSVLGLYGIMRVLETALIGLTDDEPPRWIVEGKKIPLPETIKGRMAYTLDLATSVRGTSWYPKTHWDWAPRALVNSPTRSMTRNRFLVSKCLSLLPQYLAMDILDSMNKSRIWDKSATYPITDLPWYEQLVFSTSVCAQVALSISLPYTLISLSFVLLGSYPESWPPLLNAPFAATSLADFWARRWHALLRRVFDRLSNALTRVVFLQRSSPPSLVQNIIHSIVIFSFSTTVHVLLMYRIDMRATEPQRPFPDPSILIFFLSQPLGLAIEGLVILPMCNMFVPADKRNIITRAWGWTFLLWTGRYWSDVWVNRGFWDENEKAVGWSVVRGVMYGQWVL